METKQLNPIGLDTAYSSKVSEKLNQLLSSSSVYYQNLRGLHWNISGPAFFQLHAQFELLYTRTAVSVDDIAERILTLNGKPLHTLEDLLSNSRIASSKNVAGDKEAVKVVSDNISTLLILEREILAMASEQNDDGTADLMTRLINEQEKDHWMMRAYLGN